jgi:hypothetical protein
VENLHFAASIACVALARKAAGEIKINFVLILGREENRFGSSN